MKVLNSYPSKWSDIKQIDSVLFFLIFLSILILVSFIYTEYKHRVDMKEKYSLNLNSAPNIHNNEQKESFANFELLSVLKEDKSVFIQESSFSNISWILLLFPIAYIVLINAKIFPKNESVKERIRPINNKDIFEAKKKSSNKDYLN